MTFLAVLRFIPLRVWLVLVALIAVGLWYWRATDSAYQRGKSEVVTSIQKEQSDAQNRAETERRKLDRGDDSRVRGFDRD